MREKTSENVNTIIKDIVENERAKVINSRTSPVPKVSLNFNFSLYFE